MPAQILQFNTENSVDARWLPYAGDVSRAYGTEAGRSQVWAFWLMEHMELWSQNLQSIKPIIDTNFNPAYVSNIVTYAATDAKLGWVTRAVGTEGGTVIDAGYGYPSRGWSFNSLALGDSALFRVGYGMAWDDLPESTEYPGFVQTQAAGNNISSPNSWEDFRQRAPYAYKGVPGYNQQVRPTIIYSLEPGKEFFIWITQDGDTDDEGRAFTHGIARIQNLDPGVAQDGFAHTGWFTFCLSREDVDWFVIANSQESYSSSGVVSSCRGPFYGVNSQSGIQQGRGLDTYFTGYLPPESVRWNRFWTRKTFTNASGLPFGSTGDYCIDGRPSRFTEGLVYRGKALNEQREYKGNIYLCIGTSLWWRIS